MSCAPTTFYSHPPLTLATEGRAPMGILQRLLLGAIILEIPIQFDVSIFNDERWADLGAIGGFNFSITTICLGILYTLWLVQAAIWAPLRRQPRVYICIPLTAYMAAAAISVCSAQDTNLAMFGLFMLIQAYMIFTYVANHVATRADVALVVRLLIFSVALHGVILICLHAVGHEVRFGSIAAFIEDDLRVGGTIGHPNAAAGYFELLMAPALAVLVTPLGRPTKLLAVAAIVLGGIALFLTLSRGGWLATGISFTLFFLVAWWRRWISAWLPLGAALALLVVVAIKYDTIAARIVSNDQGSVTTRFTLIEMGKEIISNSPLTGVGVNNYAIAALQYTKLLEFRDEWFHTIHNKYLLEWSELGVFGVAAYVWFLLWTLRTGWKASQRPDPLLAPIALGLTVAVAGQMVHMMVDIFDNRPLVQTLWLCAGLIAAIYSVQMKSDSRQRGFVGETARMP